MSLLIDGMKLPEDTAEIRITWSNNGNWYARYKSTDEWHKVTESKDTKNHWIIKGWSSLLGIEVIQCPVCHSEVDEYCISTIDDNGQRKPKFCPYCGEKLAD